MQIDHHEPKNNTDQNASSEPEAYEAPRIQSINLTPEAAEALT